jgi:hypothetical protein
VPRPVLFTLCAVGLLAMAARAPASGQQSGQPDWAFVKQRAAGVPDAKRQIKSRPRTSKCAGSFDCSELTHWSSGQAGTRQSQGWNKTQELRGGKWSPTDNEFETPKSKAPARTKVRKKPDTLRGVKTRTPW